MKSSIQLRKDIFNPLTSTNFLQAVKQESTPPVENEGLPARKPREKIQKGSNQYKCNVCELTFDYKYKYNTHFLRKHSTEMKYTCDRCGKKYKIQSDLRNHVRFYHESKAIVCEICGKTCSNANSLYTHQKRIHNKPRFECPICNVRVVTQGNLDQHLLFQHEQKEKFVCEECGKSFTKKTALRLHITAVHEKLKLHSCHICRKSFARQSQLRQHLLIHTGKRLFICDVCGQQFTQKPGLISHRKLHPGEHPPLPIIRLDHALSEVIKK